jgi:hypothetical protein
MPSSTAHALGTVLLVLSSASAFAGPVKRESSDSVLCRSFSSVAVGYDDCVGLNRGNTSLEGANDAFDGDATYSIEYKDENTAAGSGTGVFDLVDNGNDGVTLTFLQNVGDGTRSAVIGLKFGGQRDNKLGYFRFDAADFDRGTTLRFSWSPSFTGDGISHASVYANSVTPGGGGSGQGGSVPEPATVALMLAGLAGLAFASRRRQRR